MQDSDTRTKLLDAAQALVQRVGANAMSYQDLAEEVGIRKPSIHHHFPAKADLLAALIVRYRGVFVARLNEIRHAKTTGAAKMDRYCRMFAATLEEADCDRACPCGMLGAEIATLAPEAAEQLAGFYRDNASGLAAILDEGRRDGSLRFDGRADEVAWMLFSMLEGAMLVARVSGGAEQFKKVVSQFRRMISA